MAGAVRIRLARNIDGNAYSRLQYQLERLAAEGQEVSMLIISADTGHDQPTLQIIDLLSQLQYPLHTHVEGPVTTHGLMVYMSGNHRTMSPDGSFSVLQSAWIFDEPVSSLPYSALKKRLEELDEGIENIVSIIGKGFQIQEDHPFISQIRRVLTGETGSINIGAAQAQSIGLASQIETFTKEVEVVI